MSKTDAQKSDVEQDQPESLSVYDFFYHDARRVGSYLAQFHVSGLPQSVKETLGVEKTEVSRAGGSATVKLPMVAQALGSFEDSVGSMRRDMAERQYDPYWTHAVALLTHLDQKALIKRDLYEARIGQFVLLKGHLIVADLALLKPMWANPVTRAALLRSELATAEAMARANGTPEEQMQAVRDEVDLTFEVLPALPHSLQARLIVGDNGRLWCSLDEASLVGSAADTILKHGPNVSGEWYMLGVLDAYPYDPNATTEDGRPFIELVAEIAGAGAAQRALRLADAARNALGRPATYHGVTPILIFRSAGG